MLISHQWLNEYLDFNLSPEQLAEGLSMLGLEVEGYERLGDRYKRIVVGEVVECTRHPNADRLSLCTVDVGNERLQIVCGAPNVAVGQKVAVALVGATIPHNQHDPEGKPFVLERVRIRGVESNGMICSAYELGLGDDADGILVLERRAKVGTPLAQYLGKTDVVYEVEVTANRGDWLSHFGVAREIAAMLGKRMRKPPVTVRESKASISSAASVKILDVLGCARYSARVLRGAAHQQCCRCDKLCHV
jgi:phenylalanyl-tRNA synthetase beta chain